MCTSVFHPHLPTQFCHHSFIHSFLLFSPIYPVYLNVMSPLPHSLPVLRKLSTQNMFTFVFNCKVTTIFQIVNYEEILVLYLESMVYVHIHSCVCFQCDDTYSTSFLLEKIIYEHRKLVWPESKLRKGSRIVLKLILKKEGMKGKVDSGGLVRCQWVAVANIAMTLVVSYQ